MTTPTDTTEPFDPAAVKALNRAVEERREHNRLRLLREAPKLPAETLNGIETLVARVRAASEARAMKWEQPIHAAPACACPRHPDQMLSKDEERCAFQSERAGVLTIVHFPCPECVKDEQRARAERRLLARGIPPRSIHVTLKTWSPYWEPVFAPQRLQALSEVVRWCEDRPHPFLVILGHSGGTGKTALGVAALRSFGPDIRCLEFRDWMNRLTGLSLDERQRNLEDVRTYSALMIDDFGNRFIGARDNEDGNAWERDAMGTVLNYRFEHRLPTIITSNHDRIQFANKLDARTVDRISAGRLLIDASLWPSRRAAFAI
jgi:DNA replication protein DnaC